MYINDQSKVIIIPNFETTGVELKDGIKKDLADLKGFMKVLESYVKKALSVSSSMLKAFALFLELFPENLWLQEDENKLKMSSYIIVCHNPMFWRLSERYLFSGIALKIYELRKDAKKMFERTIPIDEGLTDVEHWWDKVSCLVLPNALREVYDYGVSQIATSYSDERSIIPFIRNTFQHYHQYAFDEANAITFNNQSRAFRFTCFLKSKENLCFCHLHLIPLFTLHRHTPTNTPLNHPGKHFLNVMLTR
ncbi:hypothetical protein KSS87_022121 [Heliosperma pusillum]|nr:hypothetical protein KSS87_022121 [Heliosperma pusillum]